jgi:molybdate/tungstate transport system substrate-binding protein
MPLVKTGEMDYIFDYPSLARQHGLRVVDLPAEIDLGDPRFADRYKAAGIEIPGADPGTKKTVVGAPIVYSIAPLKQAPNPKAAQAFIDYLLRSGGRELIAQAGMTPIDLK